MKIIVSNSSRGAYHGVTDVLKRNLGGPGEHIVIAPDRFTASVERGIIATLNIDSTSDIEVMSFTRLADKLIGKNIKKCLTPEGSVMLIGKVIAERREELEYYGRAALADGFASELYAAMTELRNSGISSSALAKKSAEMPSALKGKAHDIALIYGAYLEALEAEHSDSSTRLEALADFLKSCPPLPIHFYSTDIYDFSELEFAVLEGLAASALSLTVGVPSGEGNPNARIYPDRVVKRLKGIAGKCEIIRCDEDMSPVTQAVSKNLFSYKLPATPQENGGKVVLRHARDRRDEVLRMALDVVDKVHKGARYGDFEVFVSDTADYAREIKSAFARYSIPFFLDKKELLSEQTKACFALEAIACVRSGFRKAEVLDFVKNPLFYTDAEDGENSVFEFENYVLKYNVDRGRFFSEFNLKEESFVRRKNNSVEKNNTYDKDFALTNEAAADCGAYAQDLTTEVASDCGRAYAKGLTNEVAADCASYAQGLTTEVASDCASHAQGPFAADESGFLQEAAVESYSRGALKAEEIYAEGTYNKEAYAEKTDIEEMKIDETNTEEADIEETSIEENVRPEAVRKRLIETLRVINFKGERPMSAFVEGTVKLLDGIENAWRAHVEKLDGISPYYKKCAEQVDKKIKAVLDEINDVLKGVSDIAGFETVFKAMLKTLKIALVPTYLDCVFVGDSDSRFMGEHDLFVLGAVSGKFPLPCGGGVVLTKRDEEMLSGFGLEVTPSSREKALTAMYAVCDLLKKPHGRLVLSFPDMGEEGALRPSFVISELCAILSENGNPLSVENVDFEHLSVLSDQNRKELSSALFSTRAACTHEVLRNSFSGRAGREENQVYAAAYSFVPKADKIKIENAFDSPVRINPDIAKTESSTSVSRLEAFYACPYSHFFKYVAGLRKRKEGKLESSDSGTILHGVLELFYSDLRDGNIGSAREAEEKAPEYFEKTVLKNGFVRYAEKPETQRLLNRIKKESAIMCRDLYAVYLRSAFKPALLEAYIGGGEIRPVSLKANGKRITLTGFIDRVDTLDDKFLIVDYKTFKGTKLTASELYYGEKIQLYIYMRAVQNSLSAQPAGVFYMPVYASFDKDVSEKFKFRGQVSDDIKIMALIDSAVTENPAASVLPYKADAKGVLSKENHLSQESFGLLGDYACALAAKGAQEIASGYVKPSPVKDFCDRCAYGEICAFKGADCRRNPTVSMDSLCLAAKEAQGGEDEK